LKGFIAHPFVAVNPEKLAKIGSSAARLAHRRAAPEAQYGGLMTIY
jgi:hypothetical protein